MIKIIGYDLWRGGQKAGWVEGSHIRAHDGKRLGYYYGNHIFGEDGRKLAFIEGDYLYSGGSMSEKINLEKVNESIVGGVFPEICKCAIYVLLGN